MVKFYNLDKFTSKSRISKGKETGVFIPLWKASESHGVNPNYIYSITCLPGAVKGPYCHTKRRGLLALIKGKITFVFREKGNKVFSEKVLNSSTFPILIDISPLDEYCIICSKGSEEATLVNICDYEPVKGEQEDASPDFSEYNFDKWL